MEELTGRQFGQYRILGTLGQGGMATVYRAFQPSVNREVALKVLAPNPTDPGFLKRFRHEALILARLQHPHILPIFDSGEADGYAYLAMPLVAGDSLALRLSQGAVTLTFAERVIRHLADALDYSHSKGVVHRDIKPSNVLIGERDNFLLADFGIARMADQATTLTAHGTALGTPAYMSPEQAGGTPAGPLSDIYSLGVLAYRMLAGRVPFVADTPAAVGVMHLTAPMPPLTAFAADVPPPVEAAVLKAVARAPEDRFQSAHAFAEAFSDAARDVGRPTAAPNATAAAERSKIVSTTPQTVQETVIRPEPVHRPLSASRRTPAADATTLRVGENAGGTTVGSRKWVGLFGFGALLVVGLLAITLGWPWLSSQPAVSTRAGLDAPAPTRNPVPTPTATMSPTPPIEAAPDDPNAGFPWGLREDGTLGFVRVPAGSFLMGPDGGIRDGGPKPSSVTLPDFFIAITETTIGQYELCVKDGACLPNADTNSASRNRMLPIASVNWYDAMAYCSWLEARMRRSTKLPRQLAAALDSAAPTRYGLPIHHVVLPSEAEWEKAVRGTDGRRSAWDPDDKAPYGAEGFANDGNAKPYGRKIVGSFPKGKSPFGLLDGQGNVAEWTRSAAKSYPYRVDDGREDLKATPTRRVVRGGSFEGLPWELDIPLRAVQAPAEATGLVGFRVAIAPTGQAASDVKPPVR
jgi:serine/threonine-protein kinase